VVEGISEGKLPRGGLVAEIAAGISEGLVAHKSGTIGAATRLAITNAYSVLSVQNIERMMVYLAVFMESRVSPRWFTTNAEAALFHARDFCRGNLMSQAQLVSEQTYTNLDQHNDPARKLKDAIKQHFEAALEKAESQVLASDRESAEERKTLVEVAISLLGTSAFPCRQQSGSQSLKNRLLRIADGESESKANGPLRRLIVRGFEQNMAKQAAERN
jgi:hypothetical protein